MNQQNLPIGVFDSGLGGLTALHRLQQDLPHEDFIYFGDTARVPYGGRDRETLRTFASQVIDFLRSYQVKAILVACGTISSTVLEELQKQVDFPLIGVVESPADAASSATENRRVGIWATPVSIAAGAYARRLERRNIKNTLGIPCPKLVPLIESGHTSRRDVDLSAAIDEYLKPIEEFGVDTLILGCTHYPLIKKAIAARSKKTLQLIDSGKESVNALINTLEKADLLCKEEKKGNTRYFVSGDPEEFARNGEEFLALSLAGKVEQRSAE